jgi:hypothetical protein
MKNIYLIIIGISLFCSSLLAENIDPYQDNSQYAYGENIGWINFEPTSGEGVQVSSSAITGKVWAENIGWVNLSPSSYGGISNDGSGNLSGYAWGENVGWINFNPTNGGVTIDADGNFDGWAWGENIGWIHFQSTSPVEYKVQACVVTIDDLQNFAQYWLQSGDFPGNLNSTTDSVDMEDYSIFASSWQDFCPDGWQLK